MSKCVCFIEVAVWHITYYSSLIIYLTVLSVLLIIVRKLPSDSYTLQVPTDTPQITLTVCYFHCLGM